MTTFKSLLARARTLYLQARKAAVAVVAVVAEVANSGLVHGTAAHVASIVIAAAAAVGVYSVANKPAAKPVAAPAAPAAK